MSKKYEYNLNVDQEWFSKYSIFTAPYFANNILKKQQQVIFNGDATILIDSNKNKYISKVHEEQFDEEKGLLMCIAKSAGYTHSDIKRLLKNAKRQTTKSMNLKM